MDKKITGKAKAGMLNQAYSEVMEWFFAHPDVKVGLTGLSERLGVAKTSARRVVLGMANEKFLVVEKIGRAWQIRCNKLHPYNYTKKIASNLSLIYESGILNEVHRAVPNAKAIMLFGSYRKGDDTDESDIDIAAEIAGKEPPRMMGLGTVGRLGYRSNVRVNLFVFSRENIDINIFSNIANGIVLEGFLEVRP